MVCVLYLANSIIGPVKTGICLLYRGCLLITSCSHMLSWQPKFIIVIKYIHYFEHLLVKNSPKVYQLFNSRDIIFFQLIHLTRALINPLKQSKFQGDQSSGC